jgi:hypothetical protein
MENQALVNIGLGGVIPILITLIFANMDTIKSISVELDMTEVI